MAKRKSDTSTAPRKRRTRVESPISSARPTAATPNLDPDTAAELQPSPAGPTDAFQQVTLPSLERYRVPLVGGDMLYQPDFVTSAEADEWMGALLELDTYQPMLKLYGRTFPQSRHIAAYSTAALSLKYSGSDIQMHHPFPAVLEAIRNKVEARLGVGFNHVMLNRYDDGGVYIGRHSDNLNNLVIASISLGAERSFVMSPRLPSRARKSVAGPAAAELSARRNVKWKLANGSLVVMQGRTQEFWKHEIPKEPAVKTARISLTFRQLV
ncbi:hypothetical protein Q5752_003311 [Cryptotrichosporon argae]